jgi:hypothetical protein
MINSFDINERKLLFAQLKKGLNSTRNKGKANINLHIHSFYSYNAFGWSPYKIAMECQKAGFEAAGIIDFDVLDGMAEFYEACDQLGLKGTVGLETRTFNKELCDNEIDSPGEPGVSYIAGTGFTSVPGKGSEEGEFLNMLFKNSRKRNLALINRINRVLTDIAIDYEADVLPLTPSGNATERHIVEAYISSAQKKHEGKSGIIWSQVLEISEAEVIDLSKNKPLFEELVRKKLVKKGGIGYVQPSEDTFPSTFRAFDWIVKCGAIPTESWLDGTSEGEQDPVALLEMSYDMGARALNIIPDRNWNIKDEAVKEKKVKNLRAVINIANTLYLPLHIGTEMNKYGQPFVDDLDGPVLSEFKADFLRGAHIILGHVILSRFAGYGYLSQAAESEFNRAKDKNLFFEKVGLLPVLKESQAGVLQNATGEKAYGLIADASKKGKWTI